MHRKSLGAHGEALAKGYLKRKGYIILHENWRYSRLGEIDIVAYAREIQHLAFVEVKTRSNEKFGSPLEAITTVKQERMRKIAEIYIAQLDPHEVPFENVSFDLITVTPGPNKFEDPLIEHFPQAF